MRSLVYSLSKLGQSGYSVWLAWSLLMFYLEHCTLVLTGLFFTFSVVQIGITKWSSFLVIYNLVLSPLSDLREKFHHCHVIRAHCSHQYQREWSKMERPGKASLLTDTLSMSQEKEEGRCGTSFHTEMNLVSLLTDLWPQGRRVEETSLFYYCLGDTGTQPTYLVCPSKCLWF